MSGHDWSIVYEDNHLLAVDKPAGVPTQPDDSGDPSVVDRAKDYLRERYGKPGNIYVAAVHRLDRPVSGVLLLAKTDKAAGRLAEQFRLRSTEKDYEAVVELFRPPPPPGPDGTATRRWRLEADLDIADPRGVRVLRPLRTPADADGGNAPSPAAQGPKIRRAALEATFVETWTLADGRRRARVSVRLLTGVKHQIRAQLAAFGWPVAGDFRYGPAGRRAQPAPVRDGRAIALHARRLRILHPTRKEPLELLAPVPGYWRELLMDNG